MDLIITTESRFFAGADGRPYCADGTHSYQFWKRYLDVFDRVIVVGRYATSEIDGGAAVEGAGVQLCPLADGRGVTGAVTRRAQWQRRIKKLAHHNAAFCLRVPGIVGTLLSEQLDRLPIAYGAEIVGDPAEVFAPHAYHHPLRPWIRGWFHRRLTHQCHQAAATAYVTRHRLQSKYPPRADRFTTHYSSVDLPDEAFRRQPLFVPRTDGRWHLISVGTMSQRYKGFHVLIEALRLMQANGHDVQLTLVGEGRFRDRLMRQAHALGIERRVVFTGRVPAGHAVRQQLDRADLFVMPSLTEGLPRALIEAQARALPCLGSHVGGIPELLDPPELVAPGDAVALASSIETLMGNPSRLRRLAVTNWQRAHAFSSTTLRRRRIEFYRHLKRCKKSQPKAA